MIHRRYSVLVIIIITFLISCSDDDSLGFGKGSFTIYSDEKFITYETNYGFISDDEMIVLNSNNSPAEGGIGDIDAVSLFEDFIVDGDIVLGEYPINKAEIYIYSGVEDKVLLAGGSAELTRVGSSIKIDYQLYIYTGEGDSVVGNYTGKFQELGKR